MEVLMTSQTARRPRDQRPTRSAKARKYTKQTAHVEARRDGKPLIFGWGGHLSHNEKTRLQRRIVWAATALIGLLIVGVIVGFWVNINVVVPGLPITTVNGQAIPQSDYRKFFALDAQFEANHIYGTNGLNAQRDNLSKQVAAQQTMNQTTIPNEMQLFTQSQYGNDSVDMLQDDVFIRQWLAKQSAAVQAQVEPTSSQIDHAISDFKANLPSSTNYNKFLSDNSLSNNDARAMMTVKVRRDNMQSYLAAQIVSPLYEVHARDMTLSTQQDANNDLKQLNAGTTTFAKLAPKSVDTTTNTKGGDLGWLAQGQYAQTIASNTSAIVDNWIFDPARKPNELSPVLTENGTYHIVQILQIDPKRAVDATTLSNLKSNALASWLLSAKAKLHLTTIASDQNMLLASSNIPNTTPSLPASPPSTPTPAIGGGTSGSVPTGP